MKIFIKQGESITSALHSLSHDEPIEIFLDEGIYVEKLRISHKFVKIYGKGIDKTRIVYGDYAYKLHDDRLLYNTFRSYTMMILSDEFYMEHVTIENNCGAGPRIGQGVALHLLSKKTKLMHCQLIAHQDTLFIGPLPKDLNERYDHFLPLAERHDHPTYHHFKHCIIKGDVDYIFGSGMAYFEYSHIISIAKGYVCAPSTYEDFPYGFVFHQCQFINEMEEPVYLGRPWREYGAIALIDCIFTGTFNQERYSRWDKEHIRFYETPYVEQLIAKPLSKHMVEDIYIWIKKHFS